MSKYRAAQSIGISGWECCGTEIELAMVVNYSMTKYYPASNDGPEEFPQPEIESIRFFRKRDGVNVEVTLPDFIADEFMDSDGFNDWLTSEAQDTEEYHRDMAAEDRAEASNVS